MTKNCWQEPQNSGKLIRQILTLRTGSRRYPPSTTERPSGRKRWLSFSREGICFWQDQRLQAKTFCARTWPPFSDVPYGMYPSTAALFGRPVWNVSFPIGPDAAGLIGTDTFDGEKVSFRKGPVYMSAEKGGFCILDEINMARNESLAVLHAALDHRRIIDVPGYDLIRVDRAARFIATMNYGYAGTRDLNEALSSRFAIITMPQITEENMLRLLRRNFPDISERIAGQFVKLFGELARKAEKSEISDRAVDMRGMLDALDLIRQGLSSGQALELTIVSKTFDRYEQTLIRDCIGSRIPADLDRSLVFTG